MLKSYQSSRQGNYLSTVGFADFWGQKYATQGQYFFTRVISQRIGSVIAYLANRANLSPNAVTMIGMPFMLGASYCLALSSKDSSYSYLALLLYQLGFGFDCADGQLARATKRASEFGAWLDNVCDHIRYVSIILALGAVFVFGSTVPVAAIGLSLLLLGSGLSVGLHTVSTLRVGSYHPHGLTGVADIAKRVTKELSDTPLFLLLICLLVKLPVVLAIYISAIGLMNLVQAIALGLLRIRG